MNKSFLNIVVSLSSKGPIYDHFLVQVSMIMFSMTFYLIVYHAKNDLFFCIVQENDVNRNSSYFSNDDLSKLHQITNQSQECQIYW